MFSTKVFRNIYVYKIFACITTTYTGYPMLNSLKKYVKKAYFPAVLVFFVVVGKSNGVFLVAHNGWVGWRIGELSFSFFFWHCQTGTGKVCSKRGSSYYSEIPHDAAVPH